MTYIRRLVRGDNVYLYEVTSYLDKETGKVRQRPEYKGKEIIKDNTITVRKPRNRIAARKVLDSAPYTIYRERSSMDITSGSSEPIRSTRSRSPFTDPSWIPVWRPMDPNEPIIEPAARITIILATSLMFVRPSSAEMNKSYMPKSSANL